MIFVSVGTQLPFPRLMEYCERAAAELSCADQVYAQTLSDQKLSFRSYHKVDQLEFRSLLKRCDFMISHAGTGNIISARQAGKPIIIVPRLESLGEHRNDHQIHTARELKKIDGVFRARDYEEFIETFQSLMTSAKDQPTQLENKLGQFIKNYLDQLPGY